MATLVKDPVTGTFMANDASGNGRTMTDLNGSAPAGAGPQTSPGADPYTIFNKNVASILTQIQKAQSEGMARLGGAKDYLTSESVAPNGPTPANPAVFSGSTVAGQQALQGAFNPAITSVNTQMANTGASLDALRANLGTMSTIFQPKTLGPGESLTTPQGKVLLRTPNYQPPQIRPDTGTLDSWDAANGSWRSEEEAGGGTGPAGGVTGYPPGNSVVGGVDLSTYATDPQYGSKINGIYNTLTSTYPHPTADTIDSYIAGHAKSSPLTGQQIMQVAQHYGLDPNLMTAQLALESNFGTVGESPKNNNPGGIVFAGQPGVVQGTPRPPSEGGYYAQFKTPMDGLYAMGQILQNNKSDGTKPAASTTPAPVASAGTPSAATSNIGGQFSATATQKLSTMPPAMRPYVDAGPEGVAFVNDERVPANLKDAVQILASRAGIPFLAPADASALRSIQAVYQQLDNMEGLVKTNLSTGMGSSPVGHAKDLTLGWLAKATQTDWGNQLNKIDSFRDTAIKAVQALAGGAGSGLRINTGEIMANVQTLPTSADSQQAALQKIGQLRSFLNSQLATTFPYIKNENVSTAGASGATDISALRSKYKY